MNTVKDDSRKLTSTRSDLMRWAALAGIAGPVLFTVGFLVQEQLSRGEYDPISEIVSALAAGDRGWMQQVNFVALGVLTMVFAVGLHRGLAPSRAGIVGPVALFITGAANVLAAIFPFGKTPPAQPMTLVATRSLARFSSIACGSDRAVASMRGRPPLAHHQRMDPGGRRDGGLVVPADGRPRHPGRRSAATRLGWSRPTPDRARAALPSTYRAGRPPPARGHGPLTPRSSAHRQIRACQAADFGVWSSCDAQP